MMFGSFINFYVSIIFVLLLIGSVKIHGSSSCLDHRKIFTAKSGTISDGISSYKDAQRCKWLIQGDTDETISLFIGSFHMECGYDSLFVHDGDSDKSKLLAIISGIHQNITLTSTGNMIYLIMHSDSNLSRSGFSILYTINKCPNQCSEKGNCVDGTCKCFGDRYGPECQYIWCEDLCNQAVDSNNKCDPTKKECQCDTKFYGESCSLQKARNSQENSWHIISSYSTSFKPHAGHVSGYYKMKDALIIHGGYDLNHIYDDLLIYYFSTNEWMKFQTNETKPLARKNHAGVIYEDSLFIFGGVLSNDSLANDLWKFNITEMKWSLLAQNQNKPKVAGHTLTLAQSSLYIFGGYMEDYSASTVMHIYNIEQDVWIQSKSLYGKSPNRRLVGHTACYYEKNNHIYIFGGVVLDSRRSIPNLSNKLILYAISSKTWHNIDVVHPPLFSLAYHTAVIAGDYMVVQGGRSKFTESSVDCDISSKIYYLNLVSNVWVSESALTKFSKSAQSFHSARRFDHSVILKDFQTLIFSGGLNGVSVLRDVFAFKLPNTVVKLADSSDDSDSFLIGTHCSVYDDEVSCVNDPSCTFCSDNNLCYSFHAVPNSCSRKIRTYHSLCSLLTTCESCTSINNCIWYSISQKCYLSSDQIEEFSGWWSSNENFNISKTSSCQLRDKPAGLTYTDFLLPANLHYPDTVKIILSASYDLDISEKKLKLFKVKGRIYPYYKFSDAYNQYHSLHLKRKDISGVLNVSKTARSSKMRLVIQTDSYSGGGDIDGKIDPVNGRMFPFDKSERYQTRNLWYDVLFDMEIMGPRVPASQPYFKLLWNHTEESSPFARMTIPRNALQPYESNQCSSYISCTMCISDQSCGWCKESGGVCMLRSDWNSCKKTPADDSNYLIRNQTDCIMCHDHFDCETCVQDPFCGWDLHATAKCTRRDQIPSGRQYAAKNIGSCLPTCRSRQTPSVCLTSLGCIWCTSKQLCIPHSQYFVQNHYGECHAFYDSEKHYQINCEQYKDCTSCFKYSQCGWCYNQDDPRKGRCSKGDFSGAEDNCTSFISNRTSWAYSRCPDINECKLGLAVCKNNSTCQNIDGDYLCPCNQGFIGDGKTKCEKTCWPPCDHGVCLSNYTCLCDLGWKGINCSIDCGCNGHSTCETAVGVCDQCQDYTWGEHCEFCVNGSYGNATSDFGCHKCECNGHGDEEMNFCNITTGKCVCLNNTDGFKCDTCKDGFVGNPANNGICHLPCMKSTSLSNATHGYIMPTVYSTEPYVTCIWVITASPFSQDEILYHQNIKTSDILLTLKKMEISCFDSRLYIYDGLPPNPRSKSMLLNSHFKLITELCGFLNDSIVFRSTTGVMTVFYEGIPSNILSEQFIGYYEALQCPCIHPFICKTNVDGGFTECVCNSSTHGSICQLMNCPNNCLESKGNGKCNTETHECECNKGFYGSDCSDEAKTKLLHIQYHKSQIENSLKIESLERLGSTMHIYQDKIYVIGGRNTNGEESEPIMLLYDVDTLKWETIENQITPVSRYFHCSFLYKDALYMFGGINPYNVENELWVYSFNNATWRQLFIDFKVLSSSRVALHECVVVDDRVYIIGGFIHGEGLNENIIYIDMVQMKEVHVSVKYSLQPTGVYGHVSFYYPGDQIIYTHGGMAFYNEDINLSNRMYNYDLRTNLWTYVEDNGGDSPALFGHTGERHGDVMYYIGGYTTMNVYNEHLYIWKINCNHWQKVEKHDMVISPSGMNLNLVFLSSVPLDDKKILVLGSFNGKSNMLSLEMKNDSCHRHVSSISCLKDIGCNWCSHSNDTSQSFCFTKNTYSNNQCSSSNFSLVNGTSCDITHLQSRDCSTYTSCVTCLGNYPRGHSKCQWCRKSSPSPCIPRNQQCFGAKNTNITISCNELKCESSVCSTCNRGDCKWTNHFIYEAELSRRFSAVETKYNCFINAIFFSQNLSPSHKEILNADLACPTDCGKSTTCESCLKSFGDYGGSTHCVWSEYTNMCISQASLPMICSTDNCAQLYQKPMTCPKPCSQYKACWSCMKLPHCGWCSTGGDGEGVCIPGRLEGPSELNKCGVSFNMDEGITVQTSNSSFNYTWAFAICPLENECLNDHHDCSEVEDCQDLPVTFKCVCKPGYKRENGICKPVCSSGCVNGNCVKPDVCECKFGWTSQNCTVPCDCNGHSNCANETHPDVCLQCLHNTQGRKCSECKPLYVQVADTQCKPCVDICNGNTEICLMKSDQNKIDVNMKFNVSFLEKHLDRGPRDDDQLQCIGCDNNSEGERCETCVDGYFENNGCEKCRCNGHAETCDKSLGTACQCRHNTLSNLSCKSLCFEQQCNLCATGYHGNPKEGRQCYKEMYQTESDPFTANPDYTSFFIAKPGFTNVDMRIYIDVMHGLFDVYMTDTSDRFGLHSNSSGSLETFKIFPKVSRKKRDEQSSLTRNRREVVVYVSRTKANVNSIASFVEFHGQIQYIEGVKKRLVITVPHMIHDLSEKWFYFALIAKNHSRQESSSVRVYYRQDLPRIDLLLFFSILILVLLLILCAFILGWKLRQEGELARRRRTEEIRIVQLVSRPSVTYSLLCQKNKDIDVIRKRKDRNPYSNHRKPNSSPQNLNYVQPIALQNTEDSIASIASVFIRYPSNELSSWNFALGTGICLAPNQKLLQVRTSHQGARGKKINTRILTTST